VTDRQRDRQTDGRTADVSIVGDSGAADAVVRFGGNFTGTTSPVSAHRYVNTLWSKSAVYQPIIHRVKRRHRIYGHDTIAILWV